ncbi:MAG: hydrogenase nickel incorporation protein HypB [Spirochaetota bacterium]|nr:hydrogenase nickel incorporation protein HypB [Spirochaetota bacterium]
MCDTCGCSNESDVVTIQIPGQKKKIIHPHEHNHSHPHKKKLTIEKDILGKNNLIANNNRQYFNDKGIIALNLMSSPGSGKTTLLERTISSLKKDLCIYIIEGDQQTSNDANRIEALGVPVIQINTGNGCHLDAEMICKAINELNPVEKSIVIIENVGNLVCPSLFDLGEHKKVVIISTTEGEDKPIKYPTMFDAADVCVINKMDLLSYVDFSVDKCKSYAIQVNNNLEFFELSCKTNEGLDNWFKWLKKQV